MINKFKYKAEAEIILKEETDELRRTVAGVLSLPESTEKQPDLMYFTAIFVSSGGNLNYAYFLPSEILAAEGTIVSKPMDIEHEEEKIVGHIYDRAIVDDSGNRIDLKEISNIDTAEINKKNIHVEIAGVIYKTRFPELAKEVAKGEWKVSMETFYSNYDIKIGDLFITQTEAEALGIAHKDDKLYGTKAKVIKDNKEVAEDKVYRVLRNLCFDGCGFVKNPANPPSVVLEVSKINSNNVTSPSIEGSNSDSAELQYQDTIGICVSYKKYLYSGAEMNQDTVVLQENWCSLYDKGCTSFSRDTTDPDCLRNKIIDTAKIIFEELYQDEEQSNRLEGLLNRLVNSINKAKTKIGG